jgi:hypothetical protein
MKMRKIIGLVAVSFLLFGSLAFAVNKEITLSWQHDGADLAGFKLHYGTVSGTYTSVDVGMATKCVDIGVTDGNEYCHKLTLNVPENVITNYYFVASAYDADTPPNESAKSAPEVIGTFDFELPPIITDLNASFDKSSNTLSFSWTYETAWLPKIEKWVLWESDTSGGTKTKVADVLYDPNADPPYTTDVVIEVPDAEITKYYTMTAHRSAANNGATSGYSNEISVSIDKMPPKSPFELKVKVR